MAQTVGELMTRNPITVDAKTPIADCAKLMKDGGIGDVIVTEGDEICGIVHGSRHRAPRDRRGQEPQPDIKAGNICSREVHGLPEELDEAVRMIRERAIRRLPVVDDGKPVGIVSLGDLAVERDPKSVIADISAALPNN